MGRKVSPCPGLIRVRRGARIEAHWVARADCRAKGFAPRTVRLHPDIAPDMDEAGLIATYGPRCRALWAEMLDWAEGTMRGPVEHFDGTMASLARIYQTHAESPFHLCTSATQRNYLAYCRDIIDKVGARRVGLLIGPDFRRWHAHWVAPEGHQGPAMLRSGQAKMNMVRGLLRFGRELRLAGCAEAYEILGSIEFPTPRPRVSILTFDHAAKIVAAGIARGTRLGRSLALGQALQFELTLRQTDVIGTWESPRGPRAMAHGALRIGARLWLPGLTWEMIATGRLDGETGKTGAAYAFDLSLYPLVQQALAAVPAHDRQGPLIVTEKGEPIRPLVYGAAWRKLATACGVPKTVLNRDSRAGGVTEATDAGAPLESTRHHAQHASVSTTARYSRNREKKTAEVARIRVASRPGNKP
jgi:hypothetical protein